MKIGIVTYHRSHNYGALLQAIGLRQYLEDNGYETYFIDYWPEYHKQMYNLFQSSNGRQTVKNRINNFIEDLILWPLRSRRKKTFEKFISKYIEPYCKPTTFYFDCMICGSDQIWRKQPGLDKKFNPIYFGIGNFNTNKIISYAASMGELNVTETDRILLKKLLLNLSEISVRERELMNLINQFDINKNVKLVIDPTILLGADNWKKFIGNQPRIIENDYILYYNLMGDSFNEYAIKKFAAEKNLKIVTLGGRVRAKDYFNDTISTASPTDMLNLILYSSYVFTTSYHGLVFSLLFKRQVFCAFMNNGGRAKSLLDNLGLSDRLLMKDSSIPQKNINYHKVSSQIEDMKEDSEKWLLSVLN